MLEIMKTIVITGASDGIGAAAARQLAEAGHRVIMAGRSEAKLTAAAKAAGVSECFVADFAKFDDVRRLAADLRAATDHIDVLANNAGGVFPGPVITGDGFERTFQVNYLAGFLLTHELMDVLLASRAAVINTSSSAARRGRIDLADLDGPGRFSPMSAYGTGKLADVLHARGLHAHYHGSGLTAMAFHPGVVATNFAAGLTGVMRAVYRPPFNRFMITSASGGANLSYFAGGVPNETWQSDQFYGSNRMVGRTNPQAYDNALVGQLWDKTNELLGLAD